MSEVLRYKAIKLKTEAGNIITYTPHGPDFVPAEAYDQLRAELAALKAGQGEAVAWRDHSINYAKGDKCPATIETLQAAWDRDQELMLDQKAEISRLKETINQLRQRRTAPPAPPAPADAVSVSVELLRRLEWAIADMDDFNPELLELRALLAQSESKGVKS